MTRRIVRSAVQLAGIACVCFILVVLLDNRYSVLPTAIHNHLPAHHPGLVITDISIKTCSSLNPLSSCQLDPDKWHRIEKDLYLNKGWLSAAYLHVKRKEEVELDPDDKVVLDVRVGRLSPTEQTSAKGDVKWESRPGGLWVHRSARRHESDSKLAVTEVDVLFGPDVAEPRTGWSLRSTPLLLDNAGSDLEAHLTVRNGPLHKLEKHVPRIRKDGKFKIMQAADLHLSTGPGICRDAEPAGSKCDGDARTMEFVGKLLDQEEPDLVILSGDQINGDTAPDGQSALFKMADLFVKRGIPYAAIFGNHDDEGTVSRYGSMALLETLPYSLSEFGPTTVSGIGNYVVEVLAPGNSQHSALSLYLLDTHKYSPNEKQFPGYDWLKDTQIKWFRDTARILRIKHAHYTKIHMDMAFIHIPLPEYASRDNAIVGEWREGVTAPAFNSHFRDALVEEDVRVVSCGHDHANDFCSLERARGGDARPELWMCYGGGAGFGGYGGYGGYHRRVRFFEVDTNSARITTWKRLEWGRTEDRLDEQIVVEGGRVVAA